MGSRLRMYLETLSVAARALRAVEQVDEVVGGGATGHGSACGLKRRA